jgi:hypothetical protein
MKRIFTDEDPAEVMKANGGAIAMPEVVSFAGYSFSGKSRCMLLYLSGACRVVGGKPFVIDTERGRLREHAGVVPFQRVGLDAPYTSEAYRQAIEYCVSKGATAIGIDNMSDEHNGEGGILFQHEEFLASKAGDDWGARERWSQAGWAKLKGPMSERSKLEQYIWKLADPEHAGVVFGMTYRADEKYKPKTRKEKLVDPSKEEDLKWSVESSTKLFGWSTLRYLLMPGCNGVPLELSKAANEAERRLMKIGDRFQNVLPKGQPITADFGEKVTRMCRPTSARASSPSKQLYTVSKGADSVDKELTPEGAERLRKQGYQVALLEIPEDVQAGAAE